MSNNSDPTVGRRTLLLSAAAILGGSAASVIGTRGAAASSESRQSHAKDSLIARDNAANVDTVSGKVAGYVRNGIFTFKGMPYAATTEGVNRFMPPVRVAPWSGVRSTRQYGYVAPQGARAGWANDEEAFMSSWEDGVQSEDC
jgi:para-nitrobenzyl esterase